jgi:hypothetical protein
MADPTTTTIPESLSTSEVAVPTASADASLPASEQSGHEPLFAVGAPGPRGGIVVAVKVVQGEGQFIKVGSPDGDWMPV